MTKAKPDVPETPMKEHKTKKLTESQKELFKSLQKEIDTSFRTIVTTIQAEFNKVALPRLEKMIETFAKELEIEIQDDWVFDVNRFHFEKKEK